MKCLDCGNELADNALFCDNCGKQISQNNKSWGNEGAEENIPKAETTKSYCGNCGAELEAGAEFCGNCGARVAAAAEEDAADGDYIFCGNCGNRMPAHEEICCVCGQRAHLADEYYPAPEGKKHNKKGYVVVIAVLTAVILALAAVIAGYFMYNGTAEDSKETTEDVQISVTPSATSAAASAAPSSTPSGDKLNDNSKRINSNVGKMDTYYVVNCNEYISLREAPETSAKVIKKIPLGDPVSYVEAANNGFAKVIYNGTEGYALQSYLSDDPSDISKTAKSDSSGSGKSGTAPTSKPTSKPASAAKNKIVSNPSYNTYFDEDYNFSCPYPSHFKLYNEEDDFIRYSLKSEDGTATIKICGTKNSSGLSVQKVLDNFKSSYPGTVTYENSGDDWCVCSTNKGGKDHYAYFKIKDGTIRGFEFHSDSDYHDIYDTYINDIYDGLKFN